MSDFDKIFQGAAAAALGEAPAAEQEQDDSAGTQPPADAEGVEPEVTETEPQGTPEDEGEEASGTEEPQYAVNVDGSKSQVPLSELIASYQIGKSLDQKGKAVAAERREVESIKAEVTSQRDMYAQRLNALESALQPQLPTQEMLAAALNANDVVSYTRMKHQLDSFQAVQAEKHRVQAESQALESQRQQMRLTEEGRMLEQKMPELKDAKAKQQLAEYLGGIGFSDEEVARVDNHLHLIVAEKARRYDELMAAKPAAQQKVANAPKVIKTGARIDASNVQRSKLAEAKTRAYSNPSEENLTELFKHFVS